MSRCVRMFEIAADAHLSWPAAAEQVTKVTQQPAVQAVCQLKDMWHLTSTLPLTRTLSVSLSLSLAVTLASLQFVEIHCVGATNVAIGRTFSKVFCVSVYVCRLIWWLLLMQLALLLLLCSSSCTLHCIHYCSAVRPAFALTRQLHSKVCDLPNAVGGALYCTEGQHG